MQIKFDIKALPLPASFVPSAYPKHKPNMCPLCQAGLPLVMQYAIDRDILYHKLKAGCAFVYPNKPNEFEERIAAAQIRYAENFDGLEWLEDAYNRFARGDPA